MVLSVVLLIFSLVFILFVCAIFTNAVEWFGRVMKLGHGVTGSILAAVGTALPETIIPIIAIVFTHTSKAFEIGIGAIAGAPFMLATLGFFITGLSVVVYSSMKRRSINMNTDYRVLIRDLTFFIIIYGIAILSTFLRGNTYIKSLVPVLLLFSYVLYIMVTFRDGRNTKDVTNIGIDQFYLTKYFKVRSNLFWIIIELLGALFGIVLGSNLFVVNVEKVSQFLGVSPLMLSILITPIATELPEKFNSILWIGRRKDTLALGNITGAMVFQSCIPVSFGIAFTPWNLNGLTLISAILALLSATINLIWIRIKKNVNPFVLLSGGAFYIIFLVYLIFY